MDKYVIVDNKSWRNLTGMTFGKWLILGYIGNKKFECKCQCGTIKEVYNQSLIKGTSTSCGCSRLGELGYHSMSKSKEYSSWINMKSRCNNKNSSNYEYYGGRGIRICDRWLNSFENFYEDMGDKPKGYSIDRIESNGNYEPNNCKWSDNEEQSNNKRNCTLITYENETLTLSQQCRRFNLKIETIRSRLRLGWSIEKTFSKKINKYSPIVK